MSGTELSRVRTEFRLRPRERINQSPLESRGPTLLCNQVPSHRDTLRFGIPDATTLPSLRLCLVCSGFFPSGHRRGSFDDDLDSLSNACPYRTDP
jgi:hypothetical protein